jgi:hypothetical protein
MTQPGKRHGQATELTTLALIKVGHVELLRVLLNSPAAGLIATKVLENIATVHYAQWVIVPAGRRAYLMFNSNYDGTFDSYIDDFSDKIPLGLDAIWLHCEGWPGADDAERLKAFIRSTTFEAEAFYAAYPDATVRDVKEAFKAERVVRELFALGQ